MSFTTKDSGARQDFDSGMRRDTVKGKPRFDLITPESQPYERQMLTRWAELMVRGAEKYGDRNWEKANTVEERDRFRASAFRHFMQWYCGLTDEDHAAAVMFNISGTEYVHDRMNGKTEEDKAEKSVPMVTVATARPAGFSLPE